MQPSLKCVTQPGDRQEGGPSSGEVAPGGQEDRGHHSYLWELFLSPRKPLHGPALFTFITHFFPHHTYIRLSFQCGGSQMLSVLQPCLSSCTQDPCPQAGACTLMPGRFLRPPEPFGSQCAARPGRHSQPRTARS